MNPRPRTRTVDIYRFIRPFRLSGKGRRNGALSSPYPGLCPHAGPDHGAGKPRFVVSLAAAQGGATAGPSLSVLTQRERGCRYRWHVKVCRIRRSASPPAACDPDRTGRDRCTPFRAHDRSTDRSCHGQYTSRKAPGQCRPWAASPTLIFLCIFRRCGQK